MPLLHHAMGHDPWALTAMLRLPIRATLDTDVDAETNRLRRAAESDGFEPALIDGIVSQADTIVRDFINRGRELQELGSQLVAERAIRGDGYEIRVSFNITPRSRFLRCVLAAFRR